MMTTTTNKKTLFGHPKGLYVLFFTELWERFSYYGMRGLFTIFLVESTTSNNPGFGWTNQEAIQLYSWYTMLVYVASIPGGWLADKVFGQKKMVAIGGLLLCLGHGILALNSELFFYIGCLFIILGVGGLKPNISSMVGGLYKGKEHNKRDMAFYIFYMGINIGGFLAPILCGFVGEKINWHYGFGLAAIGMLIGQTTYYFGQKYLKGVGEFDVKNGKQNITKKPLTNIEKDRIKVLLITFLLIIIFWGAFEQAGGLMNLYARQKTDRLLSGEFYKYVASIILLTTVVLVGVSQLKHYLQKKKLTALNYGLQFILVGALWGLTLINFDKWEVPASWFQSLNSFFIILLAVPVGRFWVWWKTRNYEHSSIFKIAIGIFIMGWGFIFMRYATLEYELLGLSSMHWLILAYLFHTIGELCSSPVALSFITKLAPLKLSSLMMGAYFAATGLGNKLAGMIGEKATVMGEKDIFTFIIILCTAVTILIILLLKYLKRLTHNAESE